jgi:hypothetical protein
VRGIGLLPTTSDNAASGVTGAMNAAFGLRPAFFFAVFAIWSPWAESLAPARGGAVTGPGLTEIERAQDATKVAFCVRFFTLEFTCVDT